MDRRKNFGATVADLQHVFGLCPNAGFVCDLNHVFSIDPSMQLGHDLQKTFAQLLCGYHVSGYQDAQTLHTCLYRTGELQILEAVLNEEVTIIDEGGYLPDPHFLATEWQYVQQYLQTHNK